MRAILSFCFLSFLGVAVAVRADTAPDHGLIIAGHSIQVACEGTAGGICSQFENAPQPVAGNGVAINSGDGGPAVDAGVFRPTATAVDSRGNVLIATPHAHAIRVVCVQAGGVCAGLSDGVQIYAAEQAGGNQPIVPGTIYHLAGMRSETSTNRSFGRGSGPDCRGPDENAPAQSACLNFPQDVQVNEWDNVIIGDTNNVRTRVVCMNPQSGDPSCTGMEPGSIHTLGTH